MKVDILNATKKIAVEVQGRQHSEFNKFFHKNSASNYLNAIKRDCQKREWLELNNFTLIELETSDVKNISKDLFEKKFNISL